MDFAITNMLTYITASLMEDHLSSQSDPDIWMKDCITHYEYVFVSVDDLMVMAKDPKALIEKLINDHKYKLKGVGKATYHLVGAFFRDKDGTLGLGARTYCNKVIQVYERMFSQKPKEYSSPLDKGYQRPQSSLILKGSSLISLYDWCLAMGSNTWKIQYP
jgi:hypothetical protein